MTISSVKQDNEDKVKFDWRIDSFKGKLITAEFPSVVLFLRLN